jgi:hypothetical protein
MSEFKDGGAALAQQPYLRRYGRAFQMQKSQADVPQPRQVGEQRAHEVRMRFGALSTFRINGTVDCRRPFIGLGKNREARAAGFKFAFLATYRFPQLGRPSRPEGWE